MSDNIYWGGADHWYCGYCGKGPGHADDCARPQPTASVDAEPVAWLYEHPEAKPLLRHSRFPMSVPGWTEIPLFTEAQMQARADAARQEGAWEAGKEINALKDALAQARAEIAELKENPNEG